MHRPVLKATQHTDNTNEFLFIRGMGYMISYTHANIHLFCCSVMARGNNYTDCTDLANPGIHCLVDYAQKLQTTQAATIKQHRYNFYHRANKAGHRPC